MRNTIDIYDTDGPTAGGCGRTSEDLERDAAVIDAVLLPVVLLLAAVAGVLAAVKNLDKEGAK